MNEQPPRRGWVEAASRILKVTLQSPRARGAINTVLSYLDPEYAPELVQTALHTDPELPLALLAALPDAANIAIEVLASLTREACDKPVALMRESVDLLKARLRVATLGQAVGALLSRVVALQRDASSTAPSLVGQFVQGVSDGLRQEGLVPGEVMASLTLGPATSAVRGLQRLLDESPDLAHGLAGLGEDLQRLLTSHPDVVQTVLVPLLQPLLGAVSASPGVRLRSAT